MGKSYRGTVNEVVSALVDDLVAEGFLSASARGDGTSSRSAATIAMSAKSSNKSSLQSKPKQK